MHIFIRIGVNAKAANLRTEFSIPPKSAVREINIMYGVVSLQRVIARSYFSPLLMKPGAMTNINVGINICRISVREINTINNNVKISPPKSRASRLEVTSFSLYIGINTADKAPSPKILRNKLGNLKATFTQSAIAVVPNLAAINNSLARPKNLEISVKNATIIPDLISICFKVFTSCYFYKPI